MVKRSRKTRRTRRQRGGSKTVDLVIARYKEDLGWLSTYTGHPFRRIIIYNKGPEMTCPPTKGLCEIRPLKNVGMCDHTYLYHIVHEYDNLADITVFLPGSADLAHKAPRMKSALDNAFKGQASIYGHDVGDMRESEKNFTLDRWEVSDPDNKEAGDSYALHPASHRPFGAWVDHYLKGLPPCPYITYSGGLFALSRDMIHGHKIPFYRTFLSQLSHHKNTEAAHYMERVWGAIFYPFPEGVLHRI